MSRALGLWFWASTILSTLSGVGFFIFKYLFTNDDPFSAINHPWQPWMLRAHVLSAPVFIFIMGIVVYSHVMPRYQSKTSCGRKTGISNLVFLLVLGISGYLLPVFSSKSWHDSTAWLHIGLGFLFAACLASHLIVTWKHQGRKRI